MTGQTRPMADVDELARRTTTLIAGLARKGLSLATGVVVVVLVICGLSYLTGLAALEGSARSAWAVVGLVMLVVAVGAPLLARWRLGAVTKRTGELMTEIRSLITRDADAQRVVIETVAREEAQPQDVRDLRPVVYDSRQFNRLRQVTVKAGDVGRLPVVLRSLVTLPYLLGIALLGVVVFGLLGFLFTIAWIV
jgi:hypothetical protein